MLSFVLVSLNGGSERRALKEIQSYRCVKMAHLIFGEWDLIVEVDVKNSEELVDFVFNKLRSRDDVKLTSSLIVAGQ